MGTKGLGISDEAVRRATGRSWHEWERVLDDWGAAERSHKEIVALLRERSGVENAWWLQAVANGYEKLKGRRTVGETEGAGFQIGVRRTLPIPLERAWRLLTAPEGLGTWLGAEAALELREGETYRLADGATGEVRVVRSNNRIRLTWQPEGWPRATTIQVRVLPRGEKTTIAFHQEHLPDAEAREARRSHFKAALDAMARLAGEPAGNP